MPAPGYQRQQSDWSTSSAATSSSTTTKPLPYPLSGSSANSSAGYGHVLPSHRQQQQQQQLQGGSNERVRRGVTLTRPTGNGNGNGNANGAGYYDGGAQLGAHLSSGSGSAMAGAGAGSTTAVRRNLTRAKTLTRPDRHITPAPLLNPHLAPGAGASAASTQKPESSWFQPWSVYIHLVTFWAPGAILSALGGMKTQQQQRAWKEKVALCSIALIMGGFVGFATIGLNRTLCPADQTTTPNEFIRLGEQAGYVGIRGWMFNVTSTTAVNGVNFATLAASLSGQDVTDLFDNSDDQPASCTGLTETYATVSLCSNTSAATTASPSCTLQKPTTAYLATLGLVNSTKRVGFDWEQVQKFPSYFVIDGAVCNMAPYVAAYPTAIASDPVDAVIRTVLQNTTTSGGKDGTRLFYTQTDSKDAAECIKYRYRAGHIDKITPGCFASQLFLYVSLVVILAVVLSRFAMALVFSWFLSAKLVQPPKNLKRNAVSPAVMPVGANTTVNNATGTAPWVASANAAHRANTIKQRKGAGAPGAGALKKGQPQQQQYDEKTGRKGAEAAAGVPALADQNGMLSMAAIGAELFCVCLVTCYSEGLDSIRTTLDSIAGTDYADSRKLLFVVCDGMITGSGEKMSTPDICVSLLDTDARFDNPQPMSYLAVAAGRKQHNQAMVYAGHYTRVKGHRTPCIIVVKTGTQEEARDAKPGNRGKRDSQMILMNFFSRVTYNDRMTPLDYDLFRKCQALMGVTPDFFEVCLMVDADTKAFPDSLKQLVNCMQHDNMIMGVCGETRIANKRQSWVTAIQVYEYYISHHLAKAFESVFGGVTCLPGCFSMYRLKARKANDTDWVPVLTQSTIVSEYSQSDVQSLHEKNLLLLGEDRFLTTLMLRTFPHRKMMFCPQARCRTVAPDTFKVLLSQRRRWINSTIHNLMELVRVSDLCGTFCFSMQFMVFMDLVGTIVLPVAICLTYSLVIQSIIHPPKEFSDAIPLLLLAAVLGLPAILILLATGKVVYVSWMLIYLLSLPIWNFVLPVYAYWHFDDFSWGQTRLVAGEKKDLGHGADKVGDAIEVNAVPLRRWEDWERSRLRRLKRERKRKQEFEKAFGTRTYHNNAGTLSVYTEGESSRMDTSDSGSMFSSDDDRWGLQIGQYAEEPASHLPPVGLYRLDEGSDGETVDHERMEAMLDAGWDDDDSPVNLTPAGSVDGHFPRHNQPLYHPAASSTPPPGSYGSNGQYNNGHQYVAGTPVKMYQLSDNGPEGSSSSLTRLTQDPNDSNDRIASPLSPRNAPLGPDGRRLYDYQQPSQDAGSPGRTTGYETHPPLPGKGHMKRRSGGGDGPSGFPSYQR